VLPIAGEAPATCSADLAKLVLRLNEVKRDVQVAASKVSLQKSSRLKKAEAKDRYEKSFAVFKKYDTDKDGQLNRKEIRAYSKGHFGFELPVEVLDNICERYIKDGAKGVDKTLFHKMNAMIGVSRERKLDLKRREVKQARDKEIAQAKEELTAKLEELQEQVKALGDATAAVEKTLSEATSAKETTAPDMVSKARDIDSAIETSKEKAKEVRDAINSFKDTDSEPELKIFVTGEAKKLHNSLNSLEQKSNKIVANATKYKQEATKKNDAEIEKLRIDALAMIFHHQGIKKVDTDGLLKEFDPKKKGKVDESSFVKFLKTCKVKDEEKERMSEDDMTRLFQHIDEDDTGSIPKEQFMHFIRRFMKVIKASVMTDGISLKSKPLRRLDEGEVLECLTGPTEAADEEDVVRVKVRASKDGAEGWVTPVGNKGTTFLEDCGTKFKVVKETLLTATFEIGGDSASKDKKLKAGEILEVREWPKKEPTSGLERMKVRVKSDGQEGFVTTANNTGVAFVTAC